MLRFLIVAAAFGLAACATAAPPYAPAATPAGQGYSEQRIENDRYFVTYRAGQPADAALLQDYALLRAAELTLASGRSWFWVDRRSVDETNARSGPSVSVGVGSGSWSGNTHVGVGVGASFPIGGGGGPRARAATVEIRFGEGARPDDPNAYDANSTSLNIRARLAAQ